MIPMPAIHYPHYVRRVILGELRMYDSQHEGGWLTQHLAHTLRFPTRPPPGTAYADLDGATVRFETKPVLRVRAVFSRST